MSAAGKIRAARVELVIDEPFWGTLALSLKTVPDPTCKTAWTDGRTLGYNPAFIDSLPIDQVKGLIAHEVSHCALGHQFRREARSMKRWNVACDLAINQDLQDAGYSLPKGGLFPDSDQKGKSAEWIYSRLPESEQPQGGGNGQPNPQGSQAQPGAGNGQSGAGNNPQEDDSQDPAGEVRDAPTDADEDGNPAPSEQDWKQRAAAAAQAARMQGKMPGGMARELERALKPRLDVRALLLRFFSERAAADYSWTRPNSRYISQGLYLPAMESHSLGEVAIMVDTSGSIDRVALAKARGILESVIDECNPSGVTVYFVDTQVHSVTRLERGDPITWEPKGGGGTSFVSFFADLERGEYNPVCCIGISDLQASFPDTIPSVPVLWLSTEENGRAPFGEVVYVEG